MVRHPRIVITGATGFIAKHMRRNLIKTAQLCSISRRNFQNLRGEKSVVTECYDPETILPAIQGYDSMIHLVGIGSQSVFNDYNSANFLLAKKMIEMCQESGIQKFVYLSGLGVSRSSQLGYFISKYRAEQQIIKSGLDFTIFRPSYIVGKDDYLTRHLKRQVRQGIVTVPSPGRFKMQPVHIGDAVKVIAKSLTSGKFSNKIFDLVGPETTTYEKYARRFSRHTGAIIQKIPLEKAYRDAISGNGTGLGIDDLNLLVGNFSGNFQRMQKASGMEFHSVMRLFQSGIMP